MATNRDKSEGIIKGLILISFCIVLCQSKVFAQHSVRMVNGIVTDQHRLPLKGAIVQVLDLETKAVVSYITGVDGRYSFERLDGDSDYRIWAKDHGRRCKSKSLSVFDARTARVINFTIRFR